MPDFANRSTGSEIMDDLHVSGGDLHQALHELEAINYLLGGNFVSLNGLAQLLERKGSAEAVQIADLGCGSGDMLKLIRKFLAKRKINAELTGIDANPNVVTYAIAHTPSECQINYEALDIFSRAFRDRKFDIVTGTLFFHHFSTPQLISFFSQLKDQVSMGIVINDIHRHWFAYYSIKWLTRFFSRSVMVKHDAPESVLRAFRKDDLVGILKDASIRNYSIKWCWAFRWQVVIWF